MSARSTWAAAIIVTLAKTALASLATFSPASQDVTPGTIAAMDFTLTARALPNFDEADVVIQTPTTVQFAYSAEFVSAGTTRNRLSKITSHEKSKCRP
ncbi:MAG: hypothetical protein HY287_12285 [Planctomycetes bacterium]|nr:hypothetical protein [Planctomycetota bacterium]MBI3835099.1 hypothetical protein [Planctomycetota bacterium]